MGTEWKRVAPGLYEHVDGLASITFIPGHWELAVDRDPETLEDPWVSDYKTLAEAKREWVSMIHLSHRETYRSREMLGAEVDDCLWAESDSWLPAASRRFVVEKRIEEALLIAEGRRLPPGVTCQLCGGSELTFPWLGSTRRCRNCGAYNQTPPRLEIVR